MNNDRSTEWTVKAIESLDRVPIEIPQASKQLNEYGIIGEPFHQNAKRQFPAIIQLENNPVGTYSERLAGWVYATVTHGQLPSKAEIFLTVGRGYDIHSVNHDGGE